MIKVQGLHFQVNFVVLKMEEEGSSYAMLLGRPWFKTTKLKQDWDKNEVVLKKGRKVVSVPMVSKEKLPTSMKPMLAQTINLAEEVEGEEEDKFFDANPTVISVFEVDVGAIVNRYVERNEKQTGDLDTDQ